MITLEEYEKSLAKLEEREKLSIVAGENGKAFASQYKETIENAKKNNKHIFLFFHMRGCDGCNIVKYLLDNNDQIKEALSKYEVLSCDVSTIKTPLVQKYNVYSYPAYFIVNANDEKVIKQKIGIKVLNGPENDILMWLQQQDR